MSAIKIISIILLLFIGSIMVHAQSGNGFITGRVSTANQVPVTNATVTIQGTNSSTGTNASGSFSLAYQKIPVTLVISYIGFTTRTLTVTGTEPVDVVLQPVTTDLDEVVVQAYGTTTRRYNTGSIGKVSASEIERQPVTNPLAALQGRVPGVVITQTSGVPGSEFRIEIRGRSSLDQNLSHNDPLYVIDNVPFEPGNINSNQLTSSASVPNNVTRGGLSPLNSINPADIESIEILKDADATAIYGSRGANGVVLITTKKAKAGKARLNLALSSGVSTPAHLTEMLNTQQYVQMRREGQANDGVVRTATNSGDFTLWDTTRYTDFEKLLIGRSAVTTSLQGSLSGGNANTQFTVSGGYNRQTNVYSSELSDQVRSARFTVTHSSPDKKLSVNVAVLYSSDKNKLLSTDLTQYINLPPNMKLYDSLGNLNWGENGLNFSTLNLINPLAILLRRYVSVNDNLSGNVNLGYQLLPGLTLRSSIGYNNFLTSEQSAVPKASLAPTSTALPSAQFAGSSSKSYIVEPQAEYRRTIGNGQLTILAGATWQDRSFNSYQISASNYTTDLLLGAVGAAGSLTAANRNEQYRYSALFGRINYVFQNTYILNLSGRRDASSRFGPDKQKANFGSAGAAWIFSNTGFIKNHLPFISFGKLRGSYGITGNDQIGNYKYLDLWSATFNAYQGVPGIYAAALYNPDYAWEINKKLEGAVEFGFLKDRVLLSGAYYRNRCSNQLINYRLPSQTGFDVIGRNLPALVQNTGLELLLSGSPVRTKQVEWSVSLNMTFPKNKLVSFPGLATSSYASVFTEGKSLTQVNAYDYLGVDPQTGIYTFRDVDGNGIINAKDRILFGNLDPKYYGGLQNSIRYKGLEFSVFIECKKQDGKSYMDQLNTTLPGAIGRNQPLIVLQRWQQKGDITPIQRFTGSASSAATTAALTRFNLSSGLYTDASYWRCKNVSLSYTIPTSLTKKAHLESCRVFLHAQNLFVITNYNGSDPETQNFYVLPPLRTFVGGLQLNL